MSKKILISIVALGFLCFAISVIPQEPQTQKKIYNPDADIQKEIGQALQKAGQENKHVLLMFGANWCPWCHRLHDLMNGDKAIKSFLAKNYIIIMVDIGETKDKPLNRDLEEKYRVKGFGYPSLAILDARGELVCTQSTGVLEKDTQEKSQKGHQVERVLALLKAEAPHKEKS